MRGVAMKTVLAAVLAGFSLLIAAEANAGDRWDKWDRWERKHHHRHPHWRDDDRPRRTIVEREVYVERSRPTPVYVAPMMAPMMPSYPPQDPSVNFNFSFPMR